MLADRLGPRDPLFAFGERGAHGLGALGTLNGISAELRRELGSLASLSSCPAGAILFVEEQMPEEVFILLSGQVKQFVNSSDDRRLILHIAKPGEILGLTSVLTGSPHRATAEAFHLCSLAAIRTCDFLKLMGRSAEFSRLVASELGRSYDHACARLRTVGGAPSNTAKVARLLLEWCGEGKVTESGIQLHLALRHAEIAECIGTSRETVTRILRWFQMRQIITLRGSILTIAAPLALEGCAEFRQPAVEKGN
jgi:CRP/FNR family transcriptional regulator